MKLNEFKAWFDGYTEGMEGAPSKKQWERIKEQVAAIDGVAITPASYPVYIDRYVRPYYSYPHWNAMGIGNLASIVGQNLTGATNYQKNAISECATNHAGDGGTIFNGAAAMFAAGKAEALAS
jgi:hypothetical protein